MLKAGNIYLENFLTMTMNRFVTIFWTLTKLSLAALAFMQDQVYAVSWTVVAFVSAALGLSPIPKHGSSFANASLNFGCETA